MKEEKQRMHAVVDDGSDIKQSPMILSPPMQRCN